MIQQIFNDFELELDKLKSDCYKRKILSHYYSYGLNYDFARFYKAKTEYSEALICLFNSSMVMSFLKYSEFDEEFIKDIITFITMNQPCFIEMDNIFADTIKNSLCNDYSYSLRREYQLDKILFDCNADLIVDNPKLDDVYKVLSDSFEDIKNSYELWLTDTSHRIRHGQSSVYLLYNASTLTVEYVIDGICCIGKVATLSSFRCKGYAKKLIYNIFSIMKRKNIKVRLFAKKEMFSYYEKIGFNVVNEDIVFGREK